MSGKTPLYCASDKEIFDVLMASKQRISESILHELAKDRGIFYGRGASRDWLADKISILPHDALDLESIMEKRSMKPRAEKLTCVKLAADIPIDAIKEAVKEYSSSAAGDEVIRSMQKGPDNYFMDVEYSEIDYGKTRLIQRRTKSASIQFIVEDGATVVRFPANDRARAIMESVKSKLESNSHKDIPSEEITLEGINTPELRTQFFIELITKLNGYTLDNVTSIRVESQLPSDAGLDEEGDDEAFEDDQGTELAKEEMLHLVRNIAMKGNSLLSSTEYKDLREKGFYLSAVIWRSKQVGSQTVVEFEAGFEDPEGGRRFKYAPRGAFYAGKHGRTKTLRPIPDNQKQELLALIEGAAQTALSSVRNQKSPPSGGTP